MTEPTGDSPGERAMDPSIEVSFSLERAALLVREIELIPRFMLHEGKKQLRELFALRATLATSLETIASQKGITA